MDGWENKGGWGSNTNSETNSNQSPLKDDPVAVVQGKPFTNINIHSS